MGCDLYIGSLVMHRRARRRERHRHSLSDLGFPGTRKNGSCFGRISLSPVGLFTRPRRSVNKITTARVFSQTRARIFLLLYAVDVSPRTVRKTVTSWACWSSRQLEPLGPSVCLSRISILYSCEIVLPR